MIIERPKNVEAEMLRKMREEQVTRIPTYWE